MWPKRGQINLFQTLSEESQFVNNENIIIRKVQNMMSFEHNCFTLERFMMPIEDKVFPYYHINRI